MSDSSEHEKVSTSETGDSEYNKMEEGKKKKETEKKKSEEREEMEVEEDEKEHNKKEKHEITIVSSLKAFFLQWLNILLVFVPIGVCCRSFTPHPTGIVLGAIKINSPTAIFVTNFLAIIPLAKLLGTATENVACYTGQAIGALLNASFGNAVELILGIIALTEGLITVVQGNRVARNVI